MLNSILNSTTIPLLERLAAFSERRQEVLSADTANFDTPGYKMRDLPVADFQEALKKAVEFHQRSQSGAVAGLGFSLDSNTTSPQTLFPANLFTPSEDHARDITFQDGNNRSVEHVQMEMVKNLMMQNFAVEMMHAQLKMLEAVISERNTA